MVIIILAIKMILMECTNHQLGRGVGVNTLARIASLPDASSLAPNVARLFCLPSCCRQLVSLINEYDCVLLEQSNATIVVTPCIIDDTVHIYLSVCT